MLLVVLSRVHNGNAMSSDLAILDEITVLPRSIFISTIAIVKSFVEVNDAPSRLTCALSATLLQARAHG